MKKYAGALKKKQCKNYSPKPCLTIKLAKIILVLALAISASLINHSLAIANITNSKKYASLVYDVNTTKILYARNMNKKRYPASLTKVMTLYVLFSALENKHITPSTKMRVSRKAARQPKVRLGLRPHSAISVVKAVKALIIHSANDVAMVVAEHLAGSQKNFARMMNRTARNIGMHNTNFVNPSGLPDKRQYTTARDMIIMAKRVMIDFPEYYHLFSLRNFDFRGKKYNSHNNLLKTVKGIEGLKTGYTAASGYNVINSYRYGNQHLLAIVMGAQNSSQRDAHMKKLINDALIRKSNGNTSIPQIRNNVPIKIPQKTILNAILRLPLKPTVNYSPIRYLSDADALAALLRSISSGTRNSSGTRKKNKPVNRKKIPQRTTKKIWHIQIGAYRSKNIAKKIAVRIVNDYPIIMNGRKTYIMRTTNGLYRSRIAAFSSTEARSACNKIRKKGLDCIKVKQL